MSETLSPLTLTHGMILSDEVYTCIGSAILEGRLRPGQRLRDIELAEQLGISRTPVREALQRLERLGLVEIAVGRYTRVSEPGDQLRADTTVFTVYCFGNALRIALAKCSDLDLELMVESADTAIAAVEAHDALGLFDAMARLFELVIDATDNTVFINVVTEASLALMRNLRGWTAFVEGPMCRPDGYVELRDSIVHRDGDRAERVVRSLHGLT